MDFPNVEDLSVDHTEDRDAIAALISDIERGFNTDDAELLTGQLAVNASTVNVVGSRTTGRDAALVVLC